MSYLGYMSGSFSIEPALKWSEIRDSPFRPDGGNGPPGQSCIVLLVDESTQEDEEGFTSVLTSVSAVPWREVCDCRGLEEDAVALLEAFPDHVIRGEVLVQPTEYDDGGVWRVTVGADGVRKEAARLIWPDGSEVQL